MSSFDDYRFIKKSTLKEIADAIRKKGGYVGPVSLNAFADKIVINGRMIDLLQGNHRISLTADELRGLTSIHGNAIQGHPSIFSITLPDTVERIGSLAFKDCVELENITLPDHYIDIGKNAFLNTKYYNNADNWDNGVLYIGNHIVDADTNILGECIIKEGTKSIAHTAFEKCTGLTKIVLPNSLEIPGDADRFSFNNCGEIQEVVIPSHIDWITTILFGWYTTDIKKLIFTKGTSDIMRDYNIHTASHVRINEVVIGDGITHIGSSTFYKNDKLTTVTIPKSVMSIGAFAFHNCDNLKYVAYSGTEDEWKKIEIDNYNDELITNPDMFYKTNIIEHKTENGVNYVIGGEFAILDSYTQTNSQVVIPENIDGKPVIKINEDAFMSNTFMTSITIPSSVTCINSSAFGGCNAIKNMYYTGDIESWCNIDFRNSWANPCGNNTHEQNIYFNNNLVTELIVPNTVKKINNYTFCGFDSVTSISIPDSVTEIGNGAFDACSWLTSVNIPDSVEHIGYSAFFNCLRLSSITVGKNVKSIGSYAFYSSCKTPKIYLNCTSVPDVDTTMCSEETTIYVNEEIYDDIISDERWAAYVNQIQIKPTEE